MQRNLSRLLPGRGRVPFSPSKARVNGFYRSQRHDEADSNAWRGFVVRTKSLQARKIEHVMHTEDSETRERIIEVATVLFATQGYKSVSSRKICAEAQANHAAINYYFRNKENLYLEVLKRVFARSSSFAPMPSLDGEEGDSRKQLEQWIGWYIERLLTSEDILRYWQLVSRELQEPSEAFSQLVGDLMQPVFLSLEGIVRRILPPTTPSETVRTAALSIISQCLIYLMGGAMIEHLLPPGFRSKHFAHYLASHITTFSLAGLDALGKSFDLRNASS